MKKLLEPLIESEAFQDLLAATPPRVGRTEAAGHPDALAEQLVGLGYERSDLVLHRGEFAVRGGIVDVFPGTGSRPVRLDYFGDEIEKVREFSPSTQTTTVLVGDAVIHAVRELVPTDDIRARAERALRASGGVMRDALARLTDGLFFEGMEGTAPLLFDRMPLPVELFPEGAALVLAPARRVLDRAAAVAGEAAMLAEATGAPNSVAAPQLALAGEDRYELTEFAEGIDLGI